MPERRSIRSVDPGWTLSPSDQGRRRSAAGGGSVAGEDPLVAQLVATGQVEVAAERTATSSGRRAAEAAVTIEVPTAPGEALVLLARHASGAITLHPPQTVSGRRGAARGGVTRFHVPVRGAGPVARRGIVSRVVRLVVFKALEKVAGWALQRLARRWEERRLRGRLGWVAITAESLRAALDGSGQLAPVKGGKAFGERNLLLLHGTFSTTEGAFGKLAAARAADGRTFLDWAKSTYGDRIFGFNHFTVSADLEENARLLLDGLPDRPTRFDVVTHSRGGLVLRTLLERRAELGPGARRFELGRAVLGAVPNQGTPLASAERWDDTVGWVANLIDLFPDNPFTLGAEFVAEGLNWIAQRVVGGLPGLAAMDPAGAAISGIQGPPGPPPGALAALAANFEPGDLGPRLLDAGVDGFFAGANDLVVPSAGGWSVGGGNGDLLQAERIGCYGPGGNLEGDRIHHLNLFAQPASVDFVIRALEGRASGLPPLDPARQLPFRGRFRRALAPAAEPPPPDRPAAPAPAPAPAAAPAPVARRREAAADDGSAWPRDALQLFILARPDDPGVKAAQLLATYRNARVMAPFHTGKGKRRRAEVVPTAVEEAGQRFQDIINFDRGVRAYVDGVHGAPELPGDQELRGVGELLFATLFPEQVQRLYDEVRSSREGGRLDIVLTSMIPWIAALPWEFAFDPQRKTFLATEEINFVRNVQTAIPADYIAPRPAPLRILAVAAQPIGSGALSVEEEIELVGRGFRGLSEAGLITYEVARETTPETLHKRLLHAQLAGVPFDILHFIGHGEYDRENDEGFLLFEDDRGGKSRVDTGNLRQILCRRGLRLIFLNACETGSGGQNDFNSGVAPGLVAGGVPAVVGNQYKVLDPSATAFAQHFYWALARGATIGDAAREARVAVNYSISGEAIDWAVPVVFAQNPCERLCKPSAEKPSVAAAVVAATAAPVVGRRGRRGRLRRKRAGLWDVNHAIPGLRVVAQRLEEAQPEYEFEIVDLTAPLGTWRLTRDTDASDAPGYLYAEQVGERLRDRPAQLGLDYLFCITTFRFGDRKWRDLVCWDNEGENGRILLISLAGYEDALQPPHLPLERALANLVVCSLAPCGPHHRGPNDCPLYFNREHDPRCIAGPLRFCPQCTTQLVETMTAEGREALEALLTVYGGAPAASGKQRKPRGGAKSPAARRKGKALAQRGKEKAPARSRGRGKALKGK